MKYWFSIALLFLFCTAMFVSATDGSVGVPKKQNIEFSIVKPNVQSFENLTLESANVINYDVSQAQVLSLVNPVRDRGAIVSRNGVSFKGHSYCINLINRNNKLSTTKTLHSLNRVIYRNPNNFG